jgi:hypothetical protein
MHVIPVPRRLRQEDPALLHSKTLVQKNKKQKTKKPKQTTRTKQVKHTFYHYSTSLPLGYSFLFLMGLGFELRIHIYKAGTLLLEPHPQHILLYFALVILEMGP